MAFEPKGRIVNNRPVRQSTLKRVAEPRLIFTEPLCPRLRKEYRQLPNAIGFVHKIVSEDEE